VAVVSLALCLCCVELKLVGTFGTETHVAL
jgi:hypothetical protein